MMFWAVAFFAITISATSAAELYPNIALLKHQKDPSSIQISCERITDLKITCDLVQQRVRIKSPSAFDRKSILERIKSEGISPRDDKDCSTVTEIADIFNKGATATTVVDDRQKIMNRLERLHPQERIDKKNLFTAMKEHACKPSVEAMLKVFEIEHEKNARTCLVSINRHFPDNLHLVANVSASRYQKNDFFPTGDVTASI